MAVKQNRNYELIIETRDGQTITVKPPIAINFDCNRNYDATANSFGIQIYNLGKETRDRIRKDQFGDKARQVVLRAGYGDNMAEVIRGQMYQCSSAKQGTDIVSRIEGFDAGIAFAQSIVSVSYAGATPKKAIIKDLMQRLNKDFGVNIGAIGDFEGKLGRGASYIGTATDLLRMITDGNFHIDNGTAHALQDNECLDDNVLVIDASSGLLETPRLENTIVSIEILFEPAVKLDQLVQVQSLTENRFNGLYKVTSISHQAMMSQTACGNARTTLGMVSSKFVPVGVGV